MKRPSSKISSLHHARHSGPIRQAPEGGFAGAQVDATSVVFAVDRQVAGPFVKAARGWAITASPASSNKSDGR